MSFSTCLDLDSVKKGGYKVSIYGIHVDIKYPVDRQVDDQFSVGHLACGSLFLIISKCGINYAQNKI